MELNSEEDIILDTENVIIDTTMAESDEEIDDCIEIEESSDKDKDKNNIIIIENSKRISKNKMTRYEFVRIIGERVKQLTMGAKSMIKQSKLSENFTYSEIAIEELKLNMIPFKIRRPLKNHYEIWSISELDKSHLESFYN